MGGAGGDRAVSGNLGRRGVVRIQQAGRWHEQVQFDVHVGGGGLAGDPLHQGVGHDLVSTATIPLSAHGVGVSAECG